MNDTDKSTATRKGSAPRLRDISGGGWKTIGKTVVRNVIDDHVPIVAAGVAFFFFLALFPAIAAAVSVYGLVQDPAQVQEQLDHLSGLIPSEAYEIVASTLEKQASESDGKLGWGAVLAVLLGIWSAKKGVNAVFQGINIAYRERDQRGLVKTNLLTLAITFGGIVFGLVALSIVAVFPAFLGRIGFPAEWESVANAGRWLLLVILGIFALAVVYRVAPERESPKFRWITPGSLVATILWLLGSMLFSWYVNNFGNFDKTYGGFAAVIILMLWFYLSGFIILLGSEINARVEQQAHRVKP